MYLIKTRIDKSPIHGIGVFADGDIPEGTTLWRFEPDFDRSFTETELTSFPEHVRDFITFYAFKSPHTGKYILSTDNDRFTNHSKDPNVGPGDTQYEGEDIYIALKDIQKEEELTSDYDEAFEYEMK